MTTAVVGSGKPLSLILFSNIKKNSARYEWLLVFFHAHIHAWNVVREKWSALSPLHLFPLKPVILTFHFQTSCASSLHL